MDQYLPCKKIDCSANRKRLNKKVCIALKQPLDDDCPFYKSDPMGKIEEQIEKDIIMYANSKLK